MTIHGDRNVDALYDDLRTAHGGGKAQANGYRSHTFFLRERRALLARIDRAASPVLDIACGSGLMVVPLLNDGMDVLGIDFNETACRAARANGVPVVQGDAFNLPHSNDTIAQIVNCQFLNQQPPERTRRFLQEAARVLRPGGRLLIQWRHGESWLHRSVHAVLRTVDRVTGQQANFPQYTNTLDAVTAGAIDAGLKPRYAVATLPFGPVKHVTADGLTAQIIGASLFAEFRKP